MKSATRAVAIVALLTSLSATRSAVAQVARVVPHAAMPMPAPRPVFTPSYSNPIFQSAPIRPQVNNYANNAVPRCCTPSRYAIGRMNAMHNNSLQSKPGQSNPAQPKTAQQKIAPKNSQPKSGSGSLALNGQTHPKASSLHHEITQLDVDAQKSLIGSTNSALQTAGKDWQSGKPLTQSDIKALKKALDDPSISSSESAAIQNKLASDRAAKQAAGRHGAPKFDRGFLAGMEAQQQLDAAQTPVQVDYAPADGSDDQAAVATADYSGDDNADAAAAEAPAPAPAPLPPAPQQVATADATPVDAAIIRINNSTDRQLRYQVKKPNSPIDTITIAPHDQQDYSADGVMFVRFFNSDNKLTNYTLSAGSNNAFVSDSGSLDLVTQVSK